MVGYLREAQTVDMLSTHTFVRLACADALDVYRVMERLLGPPTTERTAKLPPVAPGPDPKAICRSCKAVGSIDEIRTVDHTFYGCTQCGCEMGAVIDRGNPYRSFEGEEDRRHFERDTTDDDHPYPMVEQLGGQLSCSTAAISLASSMLRLHPRVGHQTEAAVAALILATMDHNPTTGLLTAREPPKSFGTCAECGAECASQRDARFHCKWKRNVRGRRRG